MRPRDDETQTASSDRGLDRREGDGRGWWVVRPGRARDVPPPGPGRGDRGRRRARDRWLPNATACLLRVTTDL